jgi:hypothetical protein
VSHRRALPLWFICRAIEQGGAEHIMPVAEDIRPYLEEIADDAFDRIPAAIDLRVDGFDDDPTLRRPCGMLRDRNCRLVGAGYFFFLLFAPAGGRPSGHSSCTRFMASRKARLTRDADSKYEPKAVALLWKNWDERRGRRRRVTISRRSGR